MMKLAELIADMDIGTESYSVSDATSAPNPEIKGITCRAQDVTPGDLFVAIKGFTADGHEFIDQAMAQGASAIVCEHSTRDEVVTIPVENSRKALAELAAVYYGHPSAEMMMIGITGTNGKTTTSYLIESILEAAGISVGVIGTINYRYGGKVYPNWVTTPDALDLQRMLADMRDAGVTHVVMEVSSHALDLYRVHQCQFDLAVFTNFTQDHLDYHKTMAQYWACKRKFFMDILPTSTGKTKYRAVLNVAVPKGQEFALPRSECP